MPTPLDRPAFVSYRTSSLIDRARAPGRGKGGHDGSPFAGDGEARARRWIMDPCRVADEVVRLCQNEPKACRGMALAAVVWTRDRAATDLLG